MGLFLFKRIKNHIMRFSFSKPPVQTFFFIHENVIQLRVNNRVEQTVDGHKFNRGK